MSEQEQTPFFKVPVVPLCVDADLLALPPDTWVHIRNVSCADMGSGSCKAADAIADIQRTMARQVRGNFTMPEVADVLAAANSFDAYRFLTIEMHPAALAGALTLTNPEFGGPLVGRDSMEFHDWVTPANLDAWLERAGFPFRWPLNPEPQAATPAPVVADSADDGEAWKAKARERADEIIKRQRAKDLHPSQEDIADEIAREFRADGVMGAGGKPLTGAYIKRHALKGISSAQNRQLSTSIRRGK